MSFESTPGSLAPLKFLVTRALHDHGMAQSQPRKPLEGDVVYGAADRCLAIREILYRLECMVLSIEDLTVNIYMMRFC
jgi:hypothetical protein